MYTGLQGRVAIITGGSRGIGKAIAIALAEEGVRLALCARDDRELKIATDEIQHHTKADIIAIKANLTKLNDIKRFVGIAIKKFNRIDILINNAGSTHIGGIFQTKDEDWDYNIQLKLLGYIRMAREVIPYMRKNGGGKIINIVGTDSIEPNYLLMVSGTINAALTNFAKSLSKELEKDNITVNNINPGITATTLTDETIRSLASTLQKTPDEVLNSFIESLPKNKLATPKDIAQVVVFMASDLSNFINGVSINVDAGKVAGV